MGGSGEKGRKCLPGPGDEAVCVDKGRALGLSREKGPLWVEAGIGLAMAPCCLWHPEALGAEERPAQRAHHRRAPPLGSS